MRPDWSPYDLPQPEKHPTFMEWRQANQERSDAENRAVYAAALHVGPEAEQVLAHNALNMAMSGPGIGTVKGSLKSEIARQRALSEEMRQLRNEANGRLKEHLSISDMSKKAGFNPYTQTGEPANLPDVGVPWQDFLSQNHAKQNKAYSEMNTAGNMDREIWKKIDSLRKQTQMADGTNEELARLRASPEHQRAPFRTSTMTGGGVRLDSNFMRALEQKFGVKDSYSMEEMNQILAEKPILE